MQRARHAAVFEAPVVVRAYARPFVVAYRRWPLYVHGRLASTSSSEIQNVAVLGGGITGLTTAYYLTRSYPHAKVTVYEASGRLGGWVRSRRLEIPESDGAQVLFEEGPRTLRPRGNGVAVRGLISQLDLKSEILALPKSAPAAQNRFIYYPDHLVLLPTGATLANSGGTFRTEKLFHDAFPSVLRFAWHMARFTFSWQPPRADDESIGDFITRHVGPGPADHFASAVAHGIWAGDIWQLSMKSLFTRPWALTKRYKNALQAASAMQEGKAGHGPVLREYVGKHLQQGWGDRDFLNELRPASVFYFKGGMETLTKRLEELLRANLKVEIRTGAPVEQISKTEDRSALQVTVKSSESQPQPQSPQAFSRVISTLPALTLSSLCPSPSSSTTSLLPALASIPSATVMTINLYFRTPNLVPPGFGYLLPQTISLEQNPERALGVVFDSFASPGLDDTTRAQHAAFGTKLTVMLGGHWWQGLKGVPNEEEGVDMARGILKRHLGIEEEPAVANARAHRDCIPQYLVGHDDQLVEAGKQLKAEFGNMLRVAGSSYLGVGVADCVLNAWAVVEGLREDDRNGLSEWAGRRDELEVVEGAEGVI
ncbi:hypothetical protein BDY21DRAFT_396643 [Lineolata rhizophorae]|uniref:Protoporphyrinogen oxidase n=1 Tax=Lineolata rhizophorae TaxID=578093 RepID=A0A6A6NV03_9PEZI|nr:hypothetical protein BDY21DRAFT_396643 [Lineolata rhizophorae]